MPLTAVLVSLCGAGAELGGGANTSGPARLVLSTGPARVNQAVSSHCYRLYDHSFAVHAPTRPILSHSCPPRPTPSRPSPSPSGPATPKPGPIRSGSVPSRSNLSRQVRSHPVPARIPLSLCPSWSPRPPSQPASLPDLCQNPKKIQDC